MRNGERLSRSRLNLTPMEPRPEDEESLAGVVLLTPSRMSTATLDCSFTFREEQEDDEDEEPLLGGALGSAPEPGAESLGGRVFLDDLSLSRPRSPSRAFRRDAFSLEDEDEDAAPERLRSLSPLAPRSSALRPSESYRTSRFGDTAGAGEGARGSVLSGRPTVMVRLMANKSWSVRSWIEGGTAPRRRLSRSEPEGGTGAGSFSKSPERFSARERERFFFFLPPSRLLPLCRSRLEEDDEDAAGGGEAERRRRLRFSRERERWLPRLRSALRERERRRERERDRRRAVEWEPSLRSRERCFLASQVGESGGAGSPLRCRSLRAFFRAGGGPGEAERWR